MRLLVTTGRKSAPSAPGTPIVAMYSPPTLATKPDEVRRRLADRCAVVLVGTDDGGWRTIEPRNLELDVDISPEGQIVPGHRADAADALSRPLHMRVIHAIRFALGVIRQRLCTPSAEYIMMLGRGRHLGLYVAGSLAALESVLRGPERSFGWDPLDMKF